MQTAPLLLIMCFQNTNVNMMYADICTWHDNAPFRSPIQSLPQRNIFVIDDHPLMLRGYKALVKLEPDLSICDEATNGYEAMEKLYVTQVLTYRQFS